MDATLWVLGSAGWMPKAGQETSCFLLEAQGQLIMLDAGTGVANLELVPEVLQRYDRLSVLLSHYHVDHLVGLMYLKRFAADKRVDVYGPGKPVYKPGNRGIQQNQHGGEQHGRNADPDHREAKRGTGEGKQTVQADGSDER